MVSVNSFLGRLLCVAVISFSVANFTIACLLREGPGPPHGVEFHSALLTLPRGRRRACSEPSGREGEGVPGRVVEVDRLRHDVVGLRDPGQRSTNPRHIAANTEVFDFALDDAQMATLDEGLTTDWDPSWQA